jgi:hypothetical protein
VAVWSSKRNRRPDASAEAAVADEGLVGLLTFWVLCGLANDSTKRPVAIYTDWSVAVNVL